MRVKVKRWNAIATWFWVANDENCGICRTAFNGCCPDCKVPGDDCPLVWDQKTRYPYLSLGFLQLQRQSIWNKQFDDISESGLCMEWQQPLDRQRW
ncbi:anaphase-promoting complex subunit 11 isoform X2 [Chiloscyllium plagiosum]|uniref:anaphase-promoting complex subunit 11 isoform X2 n=1 Tax=Chiloscyllium plagiosum TaxID=36176 RepID=UPI001CB7C7B8|nr:anaphase-promoting complex subunit 11 isoform X2 [Chiloscyllium plagiosum]